MNHTKKLSDILKTANRPVPPSTAPEHVWQFSQYMKDAIVNETVVGPDRTAIDALRRADACLRENRLQDELLDRHRANRAQSTKQIIKDIQNQQIPIECVIWESSSPLDRHGLDYVPIPINMSADEAQKYSDTLENWPTNSIFSSRNLILLLSAKMDSDGNEFTVRSLLAFFQLWARSWHRGKTSTFFRLLCETFLTPIDIFFWICFTILFISTISVYPEAGIVYILIFLGLVSIVDSSGEIADNHSYRFLFERNQETKVLTRLPSSLAILILLTRIGLQVFVNFLYVIARGCKCKCFSPRYKNLDGHAIDPKYREMDKYLKRITTTTELENTDQTELICEGLNTYRMTSEPLVREPVTKKTTISWGSCFFFIFVLLFLVGSVLTGISLLIGNSFEYSIETGSYAFSYPASVIKSGANMFTGFVDQMLDAEPLTLAADANYYHDYSCADPHMVVYATRNYEDSFRNTEALVQSSPFIGQISSFACQAWNYVSGDGTGFRIRKMCTFKGYDFQILQDACEMVSDATITFSPYNHHQGFYFTGGHFEPIHPSVINSEVWSTMNVYRTMNKLALPTYFSSFCFDLYTYISELNYPRMLGFSGYYWSENFLLNLITTLGTGTLCLLGMSLILWLIQSIMVCFSICTQVQKKTIIKKIHYQRTWKWITDCCSAVWDFIWLHFLCSNEVCFVGKIVWWLLSWADLALQFQIILSLLLWNVFAMVAEAVLGAHDLFQATNDNCPILGYILRLVQIPGLLIRVPYEVLGCCWSSVHYSSQTNSEAAAYAFCCHRRIADLCLVRAIITLWTLIMVILEIIIWIMVCALSGILNICTCCTIGLNQWAYILRSSFGVSKDTYRMLYCYPKTDELMDEVELQIKPSTIKAQKQIVAEIEGIKQNPLVKSARYIWDVIRRPRESSEQKAERLRLEAQMATINANNGIKVPKSIEKVLNNSLWYYFLRHRKFVEDVHYEDFLTTEAEKRAAKVEKRRIKTAPNGVGVHPIRQPAHMKRSQAGTLFDERNQLIVPDRGFSFYKPVPNAPKRKYESDYVVSRWNALYARVDYGGSLYNCYRSLTFQPRTIVEQSPVARECIVTYVSPFRKPTGSFFWKVFSLGSWALDWAAVFYAILLFFRRLFEIPIGAFKRTKQLSTKANVHYHREMNSFNLSSKVRNVWSNRFVAYFPSTAGFFRWMRYYRIEIEEYCTYIANLISGIFRCLRLI